MHVCVLSLRLRHDEELDFYILQLDGCVFVFACVASLFGGVHLLYGLVSYRCRLKTRCFREISVF